MNDRNGTPIHVGDVIEFYFRAHPFADRYEDGEYSPTPAVGFTTMRDVVVEVGGQFYFVCAEGGSYAWRHAKHCVVVGRVDHIPVDGNRTLKDWLESAPVVTALQEIGRRAA